jgi:hypothetical protein
MCPTVIKSWLYFLPAEAKNFAGALTTLAQHPPPSVCHRYIILLIEDFNVLRNPILRLT